MTGWTGKPPGRCWRAGWGSARRLRLDLFGLSPGSFDGYPAVAPYMRTGTVVETKAFSPDQFFFKVRAELTEGNKFQARIYYNQGHIDYAYQLFTDMPLLRWDNKEEFRHLQTYPHHHHDEQGNVKPSPLTGDPVRDIEVVLQEVSAFLSGRQKNKDDRR